MKSGSFTHAFHHDDHSASCGDDVLFWGCYAALCAGSMGVLLSLRGLCLCFAVHDRRDTISICSLACPAQVKALIDYVVVEPPADSEDNEKFIYPYKASEVCYVPICKQWRAKGEIDRAEKQNSRR